jgi:hypothetical protein
MCDTNVSLALAHVLEKLAYEKEHGTSVLTHDLVRHVKFALMRNSDQVGLQENLGKNCRFPILVNLTCKLPDCRMVVALAGTQPSSHIQAAEFCETAAMLKR